jgi:hypothetical protein
MQRVAKLDDERFKVLIAPLGKKVGAKPANSSFITSQRAPASLISW